MALSPGTQLDSCEIVDLIGVGGMGEVYRCRDTKLGRDVAVKALPAHFAQDPDRMARFTREAQVLASLNHPNIAVIHELKQVGGAQYLVMELVDGETLAEIIARGPVPLDEALKLAKQIAEAVEAAHDKGIVHRDLKPANVKVSGDGHVKVLDFGLAKVYEASHASSGSSKIQTLSALNTAAGVILGTAAYMAPEQARGKSVDRRADVWAFGCLLFEMLAGRKTFAQGETVSDTLAGILAREPEWQALPAGTPPKVRALLERCLRKDPARRLQDMGNARIEIEEARGESEAAGAATTAVPARRYERVLATAAAVLGLTTVALSARLFLAPAPDMPVLRFEAVVPANIAGESGFHLSPDGLKVAYVTSQPAQIWVRALAAVAAEALPSTEGVGAASVFWSPDSQHIGFVAEGKLKRVAAAGGPAQVLGSLAGGGNYFGTWNADGVILLASDASAGGPLLRVSDGGGETTPATELDASRKETSHRFPHFLPDGRHYLFVATGAEAQDRAAYVGDLESKERRPLQGIAAEVKYSSGRLVFIRDGALMAQPFDPDRLELTGQAFPVADPFAPAAALTYPFSVSTSGSLVFRTNSTIAGGGLLTGNTIMWWYDKKGQRGEQAATPAEFRGPELSPDAKYVAFARGSPGDIWILDIANARTDRLTSHAGDDSNPRWSPDGKTIAFDSVRDGAANLYARGVNVVGDDTLLLKTDTAKAMSDWSTDGKFIVYAADNDIWALPLPPASARPATDPTASEVKPIQVTRTAFIESMPRISPDGRWVAYASNEPGEYRVYVQSFPEPGVKQLVSTAGGVDPRWSRDGKELFYFTGGPYPFTGAGATMMAVSIQAAGSSLTIGAPAVRSPRGNSGSTSYGVAADGRFLIQTIVIGGGTGLATRPIGTNREIPVIMVILNWAGGVGGASR
jgi:Tol biopolymer transport system component